MKTSWRGKLTILTGVLTSISIMVNCGVMKTEAVSTLTAAEIESMARRVTPALGVAGAEPELPRVYLNTTYVPPAGGRTIAVAAGGDFQAAINEAKPGDIITLAAGATYTGNFTLPAKTGNGWIVIRSSAPDSGLPPAGTRITPAFASLLPRIATPNASPAVEALDGAHHFRLIGLEFTVTPGVPLTYSLISLGDRQTSLAQLPHDLILDRLYIHGTPTATLRRGISLNSASTAVIDSYISDCHEVGADSQAIGGWNGAGPFKIVNNYLEGAGENFILGGADPSIPNLVPSDIEFRRNYCFKPLSWRQGDPSYAGRPWSVKNLFELKNSQRLLIDGNTFEQNWTNAQNGYAILFTVRNQDGGAPWSVVQDVTFTNNIVSKSGGAFNMHGTDNLQQSMPSRRIRISNNLLLDIDERRWAGNGVAFQLSSGPHDVTIEHNTIFHTNNVVTTGSTPSEGLVFRNNLFQHNEYGVKGDSRGTGNDTINTYFPDSVFKRNVMVGGPSTLYPADNFFPATIDQVGFLDRPGGNYRLAPGSPYKNAGTDGKDIGCDLDLLNLAVSGIPIVTSVSSASFNSATIAPESLTSAFGAGLSTSTVAASSIPLPTVLGGTTVKVRDSAGNERLSRLHLVSPNQINYLVPGETAIGSSLVTVSSGNQVLAAGIMQIVPVAPGIFTADASGRGLPAASALRATTNGLQLYEPVARFDSAQNRFVAVPIDLSSSTDQVFLILYATGLRFRSALAAVSAKVGGLDAQVFYAGAQGTFSGLDQVNLLLPPGLAGRGEVDVALTLDGQQANPVRIYVR